MFNLCDQLPGRDLILKALANMSCSQELERSNSPRAINGTGMYSDSSLAIFSDLGFVLGGRSSSSPSRPIKGLVLGEIVIGEMTSLERAIQESRNNYKKLAVAQATVDGVNVDGINTNLTVMKVLLICVGDVNFFLSSSFASTL